MDFRNDALADGQIPCGAKLFGHCSQILLHNQARLQKRFAGELGHEKSLSHGQRQQRAYSVPAPLLQDK